MGNKSTQNEFHWLQNGISYFSIYDSDLSQAYYIGTPEPTLDYNSITETLTAVWPSGGGTERGIKLLEQSDVVNGAVYRISGYYSYSGAGGALYLKSYNTTLIGNSSTETYFSIEAQINSNLYFNPRNSSDEVIVTLRDINIEQLEKIPLLEDLTSDVLGNVPNITQSGSDFLNTGETLTLDATPETVQADAANNVYFDVNGDPIDQMFTSFTTNNLTNNQYFNDVSNSDYIPHVRFHKDNLTTQQVNTDKKLTNN